jgi:hypothetical protein
MLRRVGLVRTDVSEEFSASFIRVTRISELGTLAVRIDGCRVVKAARPPRPLISVFQIGFATFSMK